MDFNDATGKQRSTDLIPNDTIAVVQLKIRPGNAGPDGMLKRSKNGDSEALDCELKVIGGQYHNRKFWDLITVAGVTERHAKAAEISHAKLCAILESARGIKPNDLSKSAKQARQTNGWADFNGLSFIAKIGIEKGQPKPDGNDTFPDRNKLLEVITPDRRDWHPVEQIVKHGGAAAPGETTGVPPTPATPEPAKIEKPPWARKAS
jgi:hypothetical protein